MLTHRMTNWPAEAGFMLVFSFASFDGRPLGVAGTQRGSQPKGDAHHHWTAASYLYSIKTEKIVRSGPVLRATPRLLDGIWFCVELLLGPPQVNRNQGVENARRVGG